MMPPVIATRTLVRARRWMTAGLVVSILGTRLIEGGSDGLVALGVLPVLWVAVLTTAGELISFASPAIARFFSRFSPAGVLVASDLAEAGASALALIALLAFPSALVPILATYLLIAVVFPAITDVVEEFYGQQLAQADPDEAMTFNASIYSILAFVGIVVAMPLGSVLAGASVMILLAGNLVLSALGASLRFVSARTVVTPALVEQDLEDFDMWGDSMGVRRFLTDLFRTGVASPLFSFLTQTGATIGGVFVYLAVAAESTLEPTVALALVVGAFGVGATIGPWVGKYLSGRGDLRRLVVAVSLTTAALLVLVAAALSVARGEAIWWVGIGYALMIGVLSRSRAVLTTTLRQREFRGERFGRIMSWSFAATALGAIVGSWLAVAMHAATEPRWALLAYGAFLVSAVILAGRRVTTS